MIHPKTLLISRHFYNLESYIWKSIYNLKIDTISTYDIPLDRSFLKLWNGIRHVMPSTDRRLEVKEKTSMAQNAWQAFVYVNGLMSLKISVQNFLTCLAFLFCHRVFMNAPCGLVLLLMREVLFTCMLFLNLCMLSSILTSACKQNYEL